jgi:predicted NACHT family NTPase
MYLTDHDIYTQQFSENIKKILVKRQKQFQRLLGASVLGNYDYHILEYEITLQQRIKLSQSKERNFTELKVNCLNLFDFYIRQCVNFHSTLNINGICGDFDEFVEYFFGEKIEINEEERKMIESSFAHFDIPLVNPQIVCRKSQYRQNKSKNFLPSQRIDEPIKEEKEINVDFIDLIKSIRNDRWTVLLGSAGSGKTTFARWLICQFARALCIEEKNITIDGIDMGPVRIPILIRIGEFAQWLENHSNSSLLDYIGYHTWFGQNYTNSEFEILKDFVRYGNAFIILDGLDEVPTIELHNRVIDLVRVFIQSHCMSHEFVSPFDDDFMANEELKFDFRREGLFGGNLILIISRILNYTIHPLNGELIIHYTIQSMNIEYLCSFVQN